MDYLKILNIFNGTQSSIDEENKLKEEAKKAEELAKIQIQQSIEKQNLEDEAKKSLQISIEQSIAIQRSIQDAKRSEAKAAIDLERSIEKAKRDAEEEIKIIQRLKDEFIVKSRTYFKADKKNVKVSFILHTKLDESNTIEEFIETVQSFLYQSDKSAELIIISDNCIKSFATYTANFSKYENVKCILVTGGIEIRHELKEAAIKIATGDWITYLNVGDYITPWAVELIKMQLFQYKDNLNFIFNQAIMVPSDSVIPDEKYFKSDEIKINPLRGSWKITSYKDDKLFDCTAEVYLHRSTYPISWKSTVPNEVIEFEIAKTALSQDNINNVALGKQAYYIRNKN